MASLPPIPSSLWEFPFEDGLIVARPGTQGCFILNATAAILWNLLSLSDDFDQLARDYSEACRIPLAVAIQDANETLARWKDSLLAAADTCACLQQPSFAIPAGEPFASDLYSVRQKTLRISFFAEDLYAEIAPRLEPLTVSCREPAPEVTVFWQDGLAVAVASGRTLAADENMHALRAILLQELVRISEPGSEWLAVLHAGACTGAEGSILFPAGTCSGKTTLMAALNHAGIQVVTDDSAAVTRLDRRPVSMPYSLMIREGSWTALQPLFPSLCGAPIWARDGTRVRYLSLPAPSDVAEPGPTRALVFPQFQPGAALGCRSLQTFDTLVRLRDSGFWVAQTREDLQEFFGWIRGLPAYALTYGNLNEAVRTVQQLLAGLPAVSSPTGVPAAPSARA